jgi:hypothetical protein
VPASWRNLTPFPLTLPIAAGAGEIAIVAVRSVHVPHIGQEVKV